MPLPHAGLIFKVLFMLKSLTLPLFRIVIGWWQSKELSWYHFRELKIAWLTYPFEIFILIPHSLRNSIGLVSRRYRFVYRSFEPAQYVHIGELFKENLTKPTNEVFRANCKWVKKSWSIYDNECKKIRVYRDKHVGEGLFFYYLLLLPVRLLSFVDKTKSLKNIAAHIDCYHKSLLVSDWVVIEFDGSCFKVFANPLAWKTKSRTIMSRDKKARVRIFAKDDCLEIEFFVDEMQRFEVDLGKSVRVENINVSSTT